MDTKTTIDSNVQQITINGMTCNGCVAHVQEILEDLPEIKKADIDLSTGRASLELMGTKVPVSKIKERLPEKYTLVESSELSSTQLIANHSVSKWVQLRPLFLIFAYLIAASVLLNLEPFDPSGFMLDFMGLFYIVFSFFKFLDYKGFPVSFSMYDPLAKAVPFYGWVYPFLELGLGLMFLFRWQITIALVATLIILGITTIGVARTLLNKNQIQCACLGTALKLPMTQATLIENGVMIIMAGVMLVGTF